MSEGDGRIGRFSADNDPCLRLGITRRNGKCLPLTGKISRWGLRPSNKHAKDLFTPIFQLLLNTYHVISFSYSGTIKNKFAHYRNPYLFVMLVRICDFIQIERRCVSCNDIVRGRCDATNPTGRLVVAVCNRNCCRQSQMSTQTSIQTSLFSRIVSRLWRTP